MLLLLVIFMITAPMMQGGVDIQLPRAEARPLDPKSGLVVTVDRAGAIRVDEAAMSYAEFRAAFKALASRDRKSTRLNSSHANISYAVFCLKKKKKSYIIC